MTRIMQAAHKELLPPAHVPLEDCDLPFFNSVIAEFAKADWTDHGLEMAAMLARMMRDMQFEQEKLRGEGSVCYTDKGTPVVNPRKTVVQMLAGSILSMRRSLALHARAQGAAGVAKEGVRRQQNQDIENMAGGIDDDLIARPILQ